MKAEAHTHRQGVAPHGTLRSYLAGFGLSVVLTAIPFALVMTGALNSTQATILSILALAVVQVVVHMVFFLHMTPKAENGWTMMALIFTLVIVVIVMTGSLWVMYHLNANMMPMTGNTSMPANGGTAMSPQDMRQMP